MNGESIIIALISAVIPTLATIYTVNANNAKNNALQDERDKNMKESIDKLAAKVESHNNFGLQLAELKTRVDIIEKKV